MAGCYLLVVSLLAQTAAPAIGDGPGQLDAALNQFYAASGITPAAAADDATFLRRVWLDVAGRTPPVAEVRKFLDSKLPDKRTAVIDELLASEHAANHFGRLWTEYLTDRRPFEQTEYNGRIVQNFLRDAWLEKKDYRQLVSELLAGEGGSDTSGPANFLLRYNAQPTPLAGAVSKKFLGLTMQCAECHDHPFTTWKRHEFWGLAAYFGRLRRMQPVEVPAGDQDQQAYVLVVERGTGELRIPDQDAKPDQEGKRPFKAVYPQLPGQSEAVVADGPANKSRRQPLIEWVTASDNPYFAKHYVNRTWQRLFGAPLVVSFELPPPGDKVSAFKAELLDLLTKDFVASGYDLAQPLRTIVRSQAYQRDAALPKASAVAPPQATTRAPAVSESQSRELLAHYCVRPLSADETFLSMAQATGYKGDFTDSEVSALTREDFGYDQATGAFSAVPLSVQRGLALLNSDHIRGACDMAAAATQRMFGPTPGPKHIEWLFLATYGRPPRAKEVEAMLKLAGEEDAPAGLHDVAWTLLNSAEFNTNH
jgi:Protein of unknown function (DUF1549)/Protein of unknown function (DUF1553)